MHEHITGNISNGFTLLSHEQKYHTHNFFFCQKFQNGICMHEHITGNISNGVTLLSQEQKYYTHNFFCCQKFQNGSCMHEHITGNISNEVTLLSHEQKYYTHHFFFLSKVSKWQLHAWINIRKITQRNLYLCFNEDILPNNKYPSAVIYERNRPIITWTKISDTQFFLLPKVSI